MSHIKYNYKSVSGVLALFKATNVRYFLKVDLKLSTSYKNITHSEIKSSMNVMYTV
jgi:hypothetical protein